MFLTFIFFSLSMSHFNLFFYCPECLQQEHKHTLMTSSNHQGKSKLIFHHLPICVDQRLQNSVFHVIAQVAAATISGKVK